MKKFLKTNITAKMANTNEKGTFIIKPLEKGFGITLGNALRRILLSTIPGSSIFATKIKGVSHEFQAIAGVKEDSMNLILNLKNIAVKCSEEVYSDEALESLKIETWPTLSINIKGKQVVTGADIKCPAGFEVVNPNAYICTLDNADSKIEIEIYVTRGRGFKSFLENKELVNSLGIIATDSNFSPVLRVGYSVNEEKNSKMGVADELSIDVATNGAVTPAEAISLASQILRAHLTSLIEGIDSVPEVSVTLENPTMASSSSTISTSISELNLSVRSFNALKHRGIQTVQELAQLSRAELDSIENLGKKSGREIIKALIQFGITLK